MFSDGGSDACTDRLSAVRGTRNLCYWAPLVVVVAAVVVVVVPAAAAVVAAASASPSSPSSYLRNSRRLQEGSCSS